jgi:hypothetical protein
VDDSLARAAFARSRVPELGVGVRALAIAPV